MSNKLLLIVILISLLAGGVIGFSIKTAVTPRTKITTPEIRTEVYIKKVPVKITETKYLEKERLLRDTIYKAKEFAITDSLSGRKDSVEYKIIHSINNKDDSVKSRWEVSLNTLFKELVKEKLTVEIKEVPVSSPFFTDGWFWATFTSIALLALAIIF